MTDRLVVYAYNVLFGDAILIEVPDQAERRFILIDVGNVLLGRGGKDRPLLDTIKDIESRTGGQIDLYIMTHEHLDHVQGLLYAKENGCDLRINTVWMTASADLAYYRQHPRAEKKRLELHEAMRAFEAVLGASELPAGLRQILAINRSAKTPECVEYIRGVGRTTHYLHRGCDVTGRHPFTEAALRILAPEEDTSIYYDSLGPHLSLPSGNAVGLSGRPSPPAGVDAGAFYNLIDRMSGGLAESLFAIDRAANDTSLVIELTWRGRCLLFAGDAEQKSWRMMADKADIRPVDLLKVGHHGSRNATPPPQILDKILPPGRRRQAVAIVSTCPDVYHGVPDERTLETLGERVSKVYCTTDVPSGKPVVVSVEGAVR